MSDALTSPEARIIILELTVAALVAQLPPASMEEVVCMLTYVAGASQSAEQVVSGGEHGAVGHVRHWATEMLGRVLTSRKASRVAQPAAAQPTDAEP
jgi:hypothetical protein